jgi:hypothetical protein
MWLTSAAVCNDLGFEPGPHKAEILLAERWLGLGKLDSLLRISVSARYSTASGYEAVCNLSAEDPGRFWKKAGNRGPHH